MKCHETFLFSCQTDMDITSTAWSWFRFYLSITPMFFPSHSIVSSYPQRHLTGMISGPLFYVFAHCLSKESRAKKSQVLGNSRVICARCWSSFDLIIATPYWLRFVNALRNLQLAWYLAACRLERLCGHSTSLSSFRPANGSAKWELHTGKMFTLVIKARNCIYLQRAFSDGPK